MGNKPPVFVPLVLEEKRIKLIYSGNPSVNKMYRRLSSFQGVSVKSDYHKSAWYFINFLKKQKSKAQKLDKYFFTYVFTYKDEKRRDISNYIKILEDLIFKYYLEDDDNKVYAIRIVKKINKELDAHEVEILWDEYKQDDKKVNITQEVINENIEINRKAIYVRNVKKPAKKHVGVIEVKPNYVSFYFNVNMSVNYMYRNKRGFSKPIPVYKSYVQKTKKQIEARFKGIKFQQFEKYRFYYNFVFNSKRKRDISNYIKTFEDFIFENLLQDDDKKVYETFITKQINNTIKENYLEVHWEAF